MTDDVVGLIKGWDVMEAELYIHTIYAACSSDLVVVFCWRCTPLIDFSALDRSQSRRNDVRPTDGKR